MNFKHIAAAAASLVLIVGSPALAADITGTPQNDLLRGTTGSDRISGLGGHDEIRGRSGNDRLLGGRGHDYLVDGLGDDVSRGGPRFDDFYVGRGRDRVFGGAGSDHLFVRRDGVSDLFDCGPGRRDNVQTNRPLEPLDRTRGCEHIIVV